MNEASDAKLVEAVLSAASEFVLVTTASASNPLQKNKKGRGRPKKSGSSTTAASSSKTSLAKPKKGRRTISDKNSPWVGPKKTKKQRAALRRVRESSRDRKEQYTRKSFLDEYKANLEKYFGTDAGKTVLSKLNNTWISTSDASVEKLSTAPLDENKLSWARILYEVATKDKSISVCGLVNNKKTKAKFVHLCTVIPEEEDSAKYAAQHKLSEEDKVRITKNRVVVDARTKNGYEQLEPVALAKLLTQQ